MCLSKILLISFNNLTFAEAFVDSDVELEVATDDSELPDSDPGDPGRAIFFRLRGRPFNLGAAINYVTIVFRY